MKKTVIAPDFNALFAATPNPYLVLDKHLVIVAVNDAYCRATMTKRDDIIGRGVFDVFPDNPDDRTTDGSGNLHASLTRVLEYGRADMMAVQKYDIRTPLSEGGEYETRYWSPLNVPVPGDDGQVRWIIHYVEDVTEVVRQKSEVSQREVFAREQQRLIDQLRMANRDLAENVRA